MKSNIINKGISLNLAIKEVSIGSNSKIYKNIIKSIKLKAREKNKSTIKKTLKKYKIKKWRKYY